jgi:hypothetical protein
MVLLLCGQVRAQEVALPVALQYQLFAKILTYDRNLTPRPDGQLIIAVVFQPSVRPSRAVADGFVDAVRSSSLKTVNGAPVRIERIALTNPAALEVALKEVQAGAAYLAPLRATDVRAVLAVTERLGVLSMTGVPEYMEAGVAIGLDVRNGKPHIIVNLPRARAGGADLGSALLNIAEVLR